MKTLYLGGNIFDGKGNLSSNKGLLTNGSKILEVADIGTFDGFSGQRVDISGGTLLPGLIDCHVHLVYGGEKDAFLELDRLGPGEIVMRVLDNATKALYGGITSLRDLGGKDGLELAVRDAFETGQRSGPTIRAAGSAICITGGHGWKNARIADGPTEVVKAVREQIHRGADVIKMMATGGVMTKGVRPEDAHYTMEEMAAGFSEGHRFGKSCAAHVQNITGALNAIRAGVDSIEHGVHLDDECIREMIKREIVLVPTLSAPENILLNKEQRLPSYILEKTERLVEVHRRSVKRFYDAGGTITMGTDAGISFNYFGQNARELQYLVNAGISPIDALTIATGNGASLLRLDNRGEIRAGAYADLLAVAGNPIKDIAAVANPKNHRLIVKNGRIIRNDFKRNDFKILSKTI